jgi:hypothetical protein
MGAFWERGLNVMWELGWDSRFSFWESYAQGALLSYDKDLLKVRCHTHTQEKFYHCLT